MTLHVIELNDSALTAANEAGILASSPGFALAVGSDLQLGSDAEQQARLQPTRSYNKYWHELSLEPLNHDNGLRHYADIAHAHLQHLAEQAGIKESTDAILAVPGNFTREQLAIVLGLTRHTPINTVGAVNSALAASIDFAERPVIVHAELQLHQVLLTRLIRSDGELRFDSTVQVPGVGGQQFMEHMMGMATAEFIQQCRFNPRHDAGSEQALYNQLPGWLARSSSEQRNLLMELKTASTVHSAKLPRESLVAGLNDHYQKIIRQIRALTAGRDAQMLFSARFRALPGFHRAMEQLGKPVLVPESALYQSCLHHAGSIVTGGEGVRLQVSLALGDGAARARDGEQRRTEAATHVLYRHRALAAQHLIINNGKPVNGSADAAVELRLTLPGEPSRLGTISSRDGEIYIESGELEFLLNGEPATGRKKLALGDRIRFDKDDEEITLIQVRDGT